MGNSVGYPVECLKNSTGNDVVTGNDCVRFGTGPLAVFADEIETNSIRHLYRPLHTVVLRLRWPSGSFARPERKI